MAKRQQKKWIIVKVLIEKGQLFSISLFFFLNERKKKEDVNTNVHIFAHTPFFKRKKTHTISAAVAYNILLPFFAHLSPFYRPWLIQNTVFSLCVVLGISPPPLPTQLISPSLFFLIPLNLFFFFFSCLLGPLKKKNNKKEKFFLSLCTACTNVCIANTFFVYKFVWSTFLFARIN